MSTRFIYTIGFLIAGALMLGSLYLQFFENIMPCHLCTLQRLCFILIGSLFFIGILLASKRFAAKTIAFFSAVISLLGALLAGRQIWLQHLPPSDNAECGVSLQYMLKVLPLNEVIQKIFYGTAECAERGFSFLSLNMAEWALLWFVLFFVMSFYLLVKNSR